MLPQSSAGGRPAHAERAWRRHVAHKGQGGGGGSDQADVAPGQSEQELKKATAMATIPSMKRDRATRHNRKDAVAPAQLSDVANLLHRARNRTSPVTEAVTINAIAAQVYACFIARLESGQFRLVHCSARSRAWVWVSSGPLATKLTPTAISRMPSQRSGGDLLVQDELRDQRQQNIAERGGGKNVGEIGPGQGGHVGGEESEQETEFRPTTQGFGSARMSVRW